MRTQHVKIDGSRHAYPDNPAKARYKARSRMLRYSAYINNLANPKIGSRGFSFEERKNESN
jgi:hypothetical protein